VAASQHYNSKYQKRWYYLAAHWLSGDVLLSNITFLIFAVLVLWCSHSPYAPFYTVNFFYNNYWYTLVITHAGGSWAVGRVISGVCDSCVCLSGCLRSKKENAWAINIKLGRQSMAVARHSSILRSKGQRSRSGGYWPAWVCISVGCSSFIVGDWGLTLLSTFTWRLYTRRAWLNFWQGRFIRHLLPMRHHRQSLIIRESARTRHRLPHTKLRQQICALAPSEFARSAAIKSTTTIF